MLERVESMFDNMLSMMKKLKKASYEKNMKEFRANYGHYFEEMTNCVEQREDKESAAKEVGESFVKAIDDAYAVKGKFKSHTEANLNLFLIYYVFPAILLTENPYAETVANGIRDAWRIKTKNDKFQYADYNKIYSSFREKIFGIF